MTTKNYNQLNDVEKKAFDLHEEILQAVNSRLSIKEIFEMPNRQKIDMDDLQNIVNEYKGVLDKPMDCIHRFKIAKITALLCTQIPNLGIF